MNEKLKWVKEHKKEILIGTGTVIGTAVLITIGVKSSRSSKAHKELGEKILDSFNNMPELTGTEKVVDEDIFTSLAPAIEKAVLEKGLEKVTLERAYDMGDNLNKFVTVKIENVYGD